jgi:hypothetical protein
MIVVIYKVILAYQINSSTFQYALAEPGSKNEIGFALR